jgi:hypothetical protein
VKAHIPLLVALVVALGLSGTTRAITVEVPVEGLYTYYGWDTTHVEGTFSISFDPGDIQSARLRLIGNLVWPSYYGCPSGEAGVNGSYFYANMSTASGDWFTQTTYVDQRISFVTYLDWHPSGDATWEFLSSGSGSFVLTGYSRLLPDGCTYQHGSSETVAEVFDAKMVFELRDPSPVEQSTWGRIKSLFRLAD